MKKLTMSLLAICFSFVLANQASAGCGRCDNLVYHDQSIDTCREYQTPGQVVCTKPVKKYRQVNYTTTKYYQEPYTVTKKCSRQVPEYYEKTNCRYVPQYYKTTHCRMVSQPYCVQETKYRTKSYKENHVAYKPYIVQRTFKTCNTCSEEPCAQPCAPACSPCDCNPCCN